MGNLAVWVLRLCFGMVVVGWSLGVFLVEDDRIWVILVV